MLFHDEIATDPARPFQAALRHIGADPEFTPEDLTRVVFSNQKSRAGRKNQLTIEDRVELWDYFREDVARLEELLGVDLSRWAPEVTETVADESHA